MNRMSGTVPLLRCGCGPAKSSVCKLRVFNVMGFFKAAAPWAIAALAVAPSHAQVTAYTSSSAFAAATMIQHVADFEGLPYGRSFLPFTQGGIAFTALGQDFYVVAPGGALTNNPNTFATTALSADGDENFQFKLVSGSFNSIGIDYATNAYGAPVLSLYGLDGTLIGNFTVAIPANTIGFFGLISTTPIGYARSIVDRGYLADTAIDNVRIGVSTASAVPEPASWAMLVIGFGLVGAAMRRRKTSRIGERRRQPFGVDTHRQLIWLASNSGRLGRVDIVDSQTA